MADYRPHFLPPPFSYLTVIVVGIGVELVRYRLHPNLDNVVTNPYLLSFGASVGTLAIHAWSMPDTRAKAAVSAFFTQASMPTVLLIGWKLFQQVVATIYAALAEALMRLTEVAG